MIKIQEKNRCCGCSACVQRCPKLCIQLKEDSEGFLYPEVDQSLCIDCGLCEKVCPFLHVDTPVQVLDVWAVKNRDESERLRSSSGGVFIALAKEVIRENGVVFGAVFDEKWEVKHIHAVTLDEVYPMMGSKYLQSRIGNVYKEAESYLKQGRKVLFTGTPCQLAGLRKYLRKDYPNLLAVDFLCHGVPSPKVWRKYLDEVTTRQGGGKNSVLSHPIGGNGPIRSIEFRSKSSGWKKYSFALTLSEASADGDKNTVLLSRMHREDPYMQVFLSDIILRPSCYACKCKNGVNHSDLTIADYWGINQLMPDFDDDKGVGLVLVNTSKGKSCFETLPLERRKSTLDEARRFNGGFKEHLRVHPKRRRFFERLDSCDDLIEWMELCVKPSLKNRLYGKLRVLYHKIRRNKR